MWICIAGRVPAVSRSLGNCCAAELLFSADAMELLRLNEELLKQLLTPVSSADHHLVPVLVVLPSYRTVLHPYLTERSKSCSVHPVSQTTSSEETTSVAPTSLLCK